MTALDRLLPIERAAAVATAVLRNTNAEEVAAELPAVPPPPAASIPTQHRHSEFQGWFQ